MTPTSAIAYRAPSAFDGSPVKVVLTGLVNESTNGKTGPMVQSYVLPEETHPVIARRTGTDVGICGACPGRFANEGWCYVTALPLLAITAAVRRGTVPLLTDREVVGMVEGRPFRVGAFGDPAALPYSWWWRLVKVASMWTGYTHAWRTCDARFAQFTMASVEDERGLRAAQARGYRTFRAVLPDTPLHPSEIRCPAQTKATTCVACGLCNGQRGSAVSVAVVIHGPTATKFLQPRLL